MEEKVMNEEIEEVEEVELTEDMEKEFTDGKGEENE